MRLACRLHFFVRISWRMAIERDDDCLAETHAPLSARNDLGHANNSHVDRGRWTLRNVAPVAMLTTVHRS